MSEQRRFSRVPFDAESTLYLNGAPRVAHLIDISMKGALLLLTSPSFPTIGTMALLEVRLLGSAIVIRMQTEVVHSEGTRFGLRCVSIDLDSVAHLRRLLELNSGDPKLVEREFAALI